MVIIVGEDRQVIVDAGVDAAAYFSDVLIAVNFALSCVFRGIVSKDFTAS